MILLLYALEFRPGISYMIFSLVMTSIFFAVFPNESDFGWIVVMLAALKKRSLKCFPTIRLIKFTSNLVIVFKIRASLIDTLIEIFLIDEISRSKILCVGIESCGSSRHNSCITIAIVRYLMINARYYIF